MKKFLFAATFVIFASTQAFAIVGAGAHYVMNTGSLKASSGDISHYGLKVDQQKSEGLQGLGFKLWIDILPVIDIEGTFNITAGRYKTSLVYPEIPGVSPASSIDLEYVPEAPYSMLFDRASPIYGVATGDVSITYPFDLPIIRPYIGAGLSYFVSTPVVNKAFVEKVLEKYPQNGVDDVAPPSEDLRESVIKVLKNTDYESGIGGHIIAGIRFKLPIIPIAAYTNGKYYFGGSTSSQFSQGFVLEVGGGFAI